ncbi:hypothetical protein EDB84DRAFT_211797 [Lactarius hengduanensis]|nr:hypothetical protein EDB84DRAFT_211797 [Lactarius hengduanensis]
MRRPMRRATLLLPHRTVGNTRTRTTVGPRATRRPHPQRRRRSVAPPSGPSHPPNFPSQSSSALMPKPGQRNGAGSCISTTCRCTCPSPVSTVHGPSHPALVFQANAAAGAVLRGLDVHTIHRSLANARRRQLRRPRRLLLRIRHPPPTTTQTGLMLRLPAMRPWVAVTPGDTTRAEDANKAPGQSSPRRVRIRSSSVARSDNENIRSSSPLSSVHDHSDFVPHHSESAILDATDDAAVENLLDSALVTASAVPAPNVDVEAAEGEPRSSVTAAEISVPGKSPPQDEADGSDEDEEFARFMQMTLDGMARAQEGLRGVFALTRRRLVVKRAAAVAAVAPQVAAVVEGVAAVADACAPGGDGPVSAPH